MKNAAPPLAEAAAESTSRWMTEMEASAGLLGQLIQELEDTYNNNE